MDGGFTRWNKFEPAPGWNMVDKVGDVCPKCWNDYQDMLDMYRKKPPEVKKG